LRIRSKASSRTRAQQTKTPGAGRCRALAASARRK
jgi:hypothetical protein